MADAPPGPLDQDLHLQQLAGYRPMFPTRAMTAAEVKAWEAGVRQAAWWVLGQHHPDIACAEARRQWDAMSEADRKHLIRSLSGSDERAVGFLAEIATGTDALAQLATIELARLCIAGHYHGTADPGIAEAFVALVDQLFREPGRRSEVEKRVSFRGLAPQVVARIAVQLPNDHRALALDVLDARQSAALRACFDQPTATPR